MTRATDLFAVERERQKTEEGYTAEHDKGHSAELAVAGAQYAMAVWADLDPEAPAYNTDAMDWPWHEAFWKPTGDPVLDLIKAGGLLAAALDALLEDDQRTAQYYEEHAAELFSDDIWWSPKHKRWYTKWQAVPVVFTDHGWETKNLSKTLNTVLNKKDEETS